MNEVGQGGPLDRCPQCLYDLTGLPANYQCPECAFEYHEGMRMWVQPPAPAWRIALMMGGPALGALGSLMPVVILGTVGSTRLSGLLLILATTNLVFLGFNWFYHRQHRDVVVLDDSGVRTRTFWQRGLRFWPWSSLSVPLAEVMRGAMPVPALRTVSPDGSCVRAARRHLLLLRSAAGQNPSFSVAWPPESDAAQSDHADQLEARQLMLACPACGRDWRLGTLMVPCDRCGFAVDDVTRVFLARPLEVIIYSTIATVLIVTAMLVSSWAYAAGRFSASAFGWAVALWLLALASSAVWFYRWYHRPFIATTRAGLHFGRLRRGAGEFLSWAEFRRLLSVGQLPDELVAAMARPLPGQAGDMQATIERRLAAAEGEAGGTGGDTSRGEE
jgi:hypothetical protein